MLHSMTGYGRGFFTFEGNTYLMEIKTLNAKNIEYNFRLNILFRPYELKLRKLLAEYLNRGFLDCTITFYTENTLFSDSVFNEAAFRKLWAEISPVAAEYLVSSDKLFPYILNLPGVVTTGTANKVVSEAAWENVESHFLEVLKEVNNFREREGSNTEKDLRFCLENIKTCIAKIQMIAPLRIEKIKENIRAKIEHLMTDIGFTETRLEQELIFYTERLDMSEELNRLSVHMDYFIQCIEDTRTIFKGKKLNFIVQEINREINTIGSKASNSEIQTQVILAKEQLEKIKEQLANIL